MSEKFPDDDRDESDPDHDDRYADRSDHWLSSLLSALESLESGSTSRSDRRWSDQAVFDYDVSIRTGDELSADDWPFGEEAGRDRDAGQPRTRRVRSSGPSSDHHVATRTHDDELLVTVDVPGVDPDDVTVGFDDADLIIAVEGRELDRVAVPWRETSSRARLKNGVLTVQVRPENDGDEAGDER